MVPLRHILRRTVRAAPRRAARLNSSDGYYDSQSGVFVSTAPILRIFEREGVGALSVVAPLAGAGARVAIVPDAAAVAEAARDGASGVRFACCVGDRDAAVAVAAAAKDLGLSFDVAFADAAAAVDPYDAELVVGDVCDAGARAVIFTATADDVVDNDDLRELFDVLGGIDTVGTPTRRRLGLAAADDVSAADVVALAASLDVHTFDTAAAAGQGPPATAALLAALDERGLLAE